MKQIQGKSFLVRVSEGSSYRESITVIYVSFCGSLENVKTKEAWYTCTAVVILALTSPIDNLICEPEEHWFLN